MKDYLNELLTEREKLKPFQNVLTNCSRLLDEEITRVKNNLNESYSHQSSEEREVEESFAHSGSFSSDENKRTALSHEDGQDERALDNDVIEEHHEDHAQLKDMETKESSSNAEPSSSPVNEKEHEDGRSEKRKMSATEILLKSGSSKSGDYLKTQKLSVPVDKYPRYNFIGRILGPRGKYLKRIEQETDCKILIRGKGSMRNPAKERALATKPTFSHLNLPLHLLVEACGNSEKEVDDKLDMCIPILEELLVPVNDEEDVIKQQQLKELRISGAFRHRGHPSSSKYPRPPYMSQAPHPSQAPHHYRRGGYHHHPPPVPYGGVPAPHGFEYMPPHSGDGSASRRHELKAKPSSSSRRSSGSRSRPY